MIIILGYWIYLSPGSNATLPIPYLLRSHIHMILMNVNPNLCYLAIGSQFLVSILLKALTVGVENISTFCLDS